MGLQCKCFSVGASREPLIFDQFASDGRRRQPPPSTIHGWLAKWRGTFIGSEHVRNKVSRFSNLSHELFFLTPSIREWQRCGRLLLFGERGSGTNRRRRKNEAVVAYYLYFAAVSHQLEDNQLAARPYPGLPLHDRLIPVARALVIAQTRLANLMQTLSLTLTHRGGHILNLLHGEKRALVEPPAVVKS
jgi:hypothetical protein